MSEGRYKNRPKYKEKLYNRAYTLFVSGQCSNAEQVASTLTKAGYKISANTIRLWMKEKDENGNDWEDEKRLLWLRLRDETKEGAYLQRKKLREELSTILEGIFEEVKNNKELTFKTKDAAIYSMSNIINLMRQLEDTNDNLKNPLYVIQFYTDILCEIPTIRNALQRNHERVRKLIADRMLNQSESEEVVDG